MNSMVDRLVAESSVVRLFRYEQPSLVDCEPAGNAVRFHERGSEADWVGKGNGLFVDAFPPLGRKCVQTSHVKES
jgi:hypothetical protein